MKDDIQFLKDLQIELNAQDNDCQASPRFWSIMDYKWTVTAEGHEDRVSLFDTESSETIDLDDYVDEIINGERREEFEEDDVDDLISRIEYESRSNVFDWIEEHDDSSRFYPVYEERVSFIAPNTMFLTKAEAKRHLEVNGHHYSSKAHTYAMTAWRSPKVERLWRILEAFDWDKIEVSEGEE